MSQSQTATSHPRRRGAVISILLIVGLLIVFRDSPLVMALGNFVLAILHVIGAIVGLLARIVLSLFSPVR